MSASQEKKRRREERAEGTEKRQVARQKTYAERKRNKRITSIISTIVVVALIAVIVINSNLFYTALPAVTIGDTSYTTAEFNYYYFSSYYQFVNSYSDYISYFFDVNQPLENQAYSETQSWADYFQQTALNNMQTNTALCAEAEKAGFVMSQEYQQTLEDNIASFKAEATEMGYPTADSYAAAAYGRGCNMEMVEQFMTQTTLASAYYEEVYNSFSYTEDELTAAYAENKDSYDYFLYNYYVIDGAADEESGIDSETALNDAKAAAEEIAAAAKSEDLFADIVAEKFDGAEVTEAKTSGSNLSTLYADWLKAAERKYGDTTVVESGTSVYVIFYVGRDDNNYNMRQVRHILVMAEADANGAFTEDAKAAAKAEAEALYKEWKSGEATEESFAAMANEHSEDGGSNTNGGLYDTVTKYTMVEEFDAFCFDDHEYGDTDIVYGETASYAGYHIMYYVGEGDNYSTYLADATLRGEDYAEWAEATVENYPIDTKFALRFGR